MTTKMITVYLTPKPGSSTFEPTFNSDTLFGAIATAGSLLEYEIEEWLNDENLRISNTFPFFTEIEETAEKIERTHYFPVPVSPMRYEKPDNLETFLKIKKIKKLNWIPENEFLEILSSGNIKEFYQKNLEQELDDIKNVSFGTSRMIPRNTVNRLSLEVINPHSRKTRAGTNPIHYEVVPKETDGTLQIVYIPFDAVLTEDEEIKKQVKVDIEFLTKCIEKIAEIGVGAKEKLGWGRFEITNRKYSLRGEIEGLNLENWHKCEGGNE